MPVFGTGVSRAQIQSVISAQISSICVVRKFLFPYVCVLADILQKETHLHVFANKAIKLKVKG